jgi:hypothetical protein
MKKVVIVYMTMSMFAVQTFAQTFAFLQNEKQLDNNAEITVTKAFPSELDGELVLESELGLKNLTDNDVSARMTQTVLTGVTIPAGNISFCFYNCVYTQTSSGNTYREQDGEVGPNEIWISPQFHLSFYVSENLYTSTKVKYEIFPLDNTDDKTTVTIIYVYNEKSTALSHINRQNKIITSQESNNVMFTYSFDRNNTLIEVYSAIGNRIAQHYLKSAKGVFVLPEKLPEGIYIYSIKQDNKIIVANKFIVK